MRALDWQRFLQQQRDDHKVVFTPAELANVAQASPQVLNVVLQRLVKRGVLVRYAVGRYGLPGAVQAEDLAAALDSAAYITGLYALHQHGLVTQTPTEITCFTNRRHNRSRIRKTPLGRFVFMCVGATVYAAPQAGAMASGEQAFCDFILICRKRGVSASSLVTFRNLEHLDREILTENLRRYPAVVRRAAESILSP